MLCINKHTIYVCMEAMVVVVTLRKHCIPNCESICRNPKVTTGWGELCTYWIKCLPWTLDRSGDIVIFVL